MLFFFSEFSFSQPVNIDTGYECPIIVVEFLGRRGSGFSDTYTPKGPQSFAHCVSAICVTSLKDNHVAR